MAHISDIKLIRTDTTLDLSQKAEKGMLYSVLGAFLLYPVFLLFLTSKQCGIYLSSLSSANNSLLYSKLGQLLINFLYPVTSLDFIHLT
ncbi:Serine/threonine-protein kinase ZRK7 [Linum grandiflorum]